MMVHTGNIQMHRPFQDLYQDMEEKYNNDSESEYEDDEVSKPNDADKAADSRIWKRLLMMSSTVGNQQSQASIDGLTFYLDLNFLDRILWRLKLINLDFRKEEYLGKTDRGKLYSQILSAVMIFINLNFVIFEIYNFETNDLYDDDFKDDYDALLKKTTNHRDRHMHTMSPTIVSNMTATAATIALYLVIPRGSRFNQTFIINVLRSQMIITIQLLFQILFAPELYAARQYVSFFLLCVQIFLETCIFFSYLRVWARVKDDPDEYRFISLDKAPAQTTNRARPPASEVELNQL